MKKIAAALLTLALTLSCVAAMAETVLPVPAEISLDKLDGRYVPTDIKDAGDGKIELTLYETEAFSAESIQKLQAGDVIVSSGVEYPVEAVRPDEEFGDYYVLTADDVELLFARTASGDYALTGDDDVHPLITVGTMTAEVYPYVYAFLDQIDPLSGEILDKPVLYTGEEFLQLLKSDPVGFDIGNTHVLFDGNMPRVIFRSYVPWQ